jgi:hypothetical protein
MAGFTYQGETTHFRTYYSNGLLNHGPGNICLLKTNTRWRTTWSIITPGNFSRRPFEDLLFYDPTAGVGEIYTTEGGNLSLLKSDPSWRHSWSIIVPCNLTGRPYSDLLFYDPTTGVGEAYTTDGHGNISHLQSYSWSNRWSAIVPCKFTPGRYSDFLFYDSNVGTAAMYSTDGQGTLAPLKIYTGLRTTWSVVKACNIIGSHLSDGRPGPPAFFMAPAGFVFYDPIAGVGEFYSTDSEGNIALVNSDPTWQKTWSIITPGNFTRGLADDLLFYDPTAGVGEFYTSRGNTLATAVLSTCEADYGALYGYFPLIPDGIPFLIHVQPGQKGARHQGSGNTSIYCDAFTGNDSDLLRFDIVAEAAEVFMNEFGWDANKSNGEALSRIIAAKLYPNELMTEQGGNVVDSSTGPAWLASDQPDYVNNTEGTDQNPISIGCATLFINYMHHQLGFDLNQIINAAGETLSDTYSVLTSRFDAYESFKKLLARRFPGPDFLPLKGADNPYPIHPDILAYDADAHTGEFYSTDSQGNLSPLTSDSSWRGTWSIIAPGNYTLSRFSDILFYDAAAGVLEFYTSDGQGHIHLLRSHDGLSTGWTKIIPVRFTQRPNDNLLLYDRSAGTGEIFTIDGEGNLQLLNKNIGWRTSWSQIIAACFIAGSSHDLFFYDSTEGVAELYSTNDSGVPELVNRFSNWSKTWSIIIACNMTGRPFTDLLLYDRAAGIAEIWSSDGKGNLNLLEHSPTSTTWSHIQAIAFEELMFYDAAAGVVEFHNGLGGVRTRFTGLPQTWSIIASGNFT